MRLGQYLMGTVLVLVGTARAIADGSHLAVVLPATAALLVWLFADVLLPRRARHEHTALWWLGIGITIWLGAVFVSSDFVWLAFIFWLLAGHLLPLLPAIAVSLALLGVVVVAPIMHHGTTTAGNIVGPLVGGAFAFGISRGYLELLREAARREALVQSLQKAQAETTNLQDELALSQRRAGELAERSRLARDIHDTVAQSFSSLRLIAHAASTATTDPEARRSLEQIEALSGEGLTDVRRIIAELTPAELDDGALGDALARMLERLEQHHGLRTAITVDRSLPTLDAVTEVALLRAAQSVLANVRNHAEATQVTVHLIDEGDSVRLDILDNGIGFAPDRVDPATSSFGLRFLRNRLRELGGDLVVESAPGEGTACSAHLPIRRGEDPALPAANERTSND